MISRRLTLTISGLVAFAITIFVAYYLLLTDNFLHTSIADIIRTSHHLAIRTHLLILGLLPVYIAGLVFGAVLFGLYLTPRIEFFLLKVARNK